MSEHADAIETQADHKGPPATGGQNARPNRSAARQWASLLLVLHCLVVALILSGSPRPSPLQQRLRVVLAPYATTLHLDPAPADFYWTHGEPIDAGHQVELLTPGEAGGAEWRQAGRYFRGSPARLRQQRAARTLARLVEEEAEEDVARLVRDTARWAVANGLQPTRLRLQRQNLQRPSDVDAPAEARRDPTDPSYFETLYEADLLISGDEVFVVKRTPAAEAAPVTPSGGGGGGP